ncbi:MAG: hypothetical protein WC159_09835, partial [Sphaerochaetaceae bacterium]
MSHSPLLLQFWMVLTVMPRNPQVDLSATPRDFASCTKARIPSFSVSEVSSPRPETGPDVFFKGQQHCDIGKSLLFYSQFA